MSQDPWQNPNEQQGDASPTPPPQFPSYPGDAYGYGYGAPELARPPMPNSVRIAVNLMFAGLAVEAINMVLGPTQIGAVQDHLRSLGYSETTVNNDKGVFVASVVIGGLIRSGLWLWMALAIRGGHNYARIVSTVFFGFGVLGSLINLSSNWLPAVDKIGSVATLIVGLLAIIYVWRGESGPYFQPRQGYGTGQPGQPGQSPYDHR